MDNKEIAAHFSLLSKLMELHGENSFRAKTYSVAAYRIGKLPVELSSLSASQAAQLEGIGDTIAAKIKELLSTGNIKMLEDLIKKTPEGIFEMLKIKGIGPKKIGLIWKQMNIENIGELLYACNENRLLLYKGFGKKTQDNVIESIEFYLSQQGSYLYAQVHLLAEQLTTLLKKLFTGARVQLTGDMVRHAETIELIEYIIDQPLNTIAAVLGPIDEFSFSDEDESSLTYQYNNGIKIKLHAVKKDEWTQKLFATTGSVEFITAFHQHFPGVDFTAAKNEDDLFKQAGLPFIPPFLRENESILSHAKGDNLSVVIEPTDIKGIIHSHSNWSDGIDTLEKLSQACKKSGKEYLVISDHSKSAFYAHGLDESQIRAQHEQIDELNEKLKPFKIFKSIESDILNDGSLDYSNDVLATFDLVIASVHSNLKMSEEKATARLLRAIENPYTTILGHMTGRLLLSRRGFPVDHIKIIDACAANNVVIEINAHPRRLDMRWQWLEYALSKNVLVSIDPDAHSIAEFENTRYGVLVAQKGMVTKENNLSSFSLPALEKFLKDRKKLKGI